MNALEAKPFFTHHRIVLSPAAENASLADPPAAGIQKELLLRGASGEEMIRGALRCGGWKTISVRVEFTGGTTPTITFQPLEVMHYNEDGDGDLKDKLVVQGSNIGPLSDGDSATVTVNGADLFLRIQAVTGAPTKVEVLAAGLERDLEALRVG